MLHFHANASWRAIGGGDGSHLQKDIAFLCRRFDKIHLPSSTTDHLDVPVWV